MITRLRIVSKADKVFYIQEERRTVFWFTQEWCVLFLDGIHKYDSFGAAESAVLKEIDRICTLNSPLVVVKVYDV